MLKKLISFLMVLAITTSLFTGVTIVSASEGNTYFTFNDANLAEKYANDSGESALSKMTLNTDTDYTYGNAMYSGLIDLSKEKWGTEKASIAKMGMTTDWSGYDVLRVRYYSTIADAFYSIFFYEDAAASKKYRFTVQADKIGWQVAEIDLNRLRKTNTTSLSEINYIQIRTDNNEDGTGSKYEICGSGLTTGLQLYFDKMWLEKYDAGSFLSFADSTTFSNWTKPDGTNGKSKLAESGSVLMGAARCGRLDLTSQKWGTDAGSLSNMGMTTDWSKYDTLNIRFNSTIENAFFTIFFYGSDSLASGAQYKVKVTARRKGWQTFEIPLANMTAKNSPDLNSVKYIQIRTDGGSDGGQIVGSGKDGGVENLKFYFDKIWLSNADVIAPHDFKYVYANGEAVIKGIDALSAEEQVNMEIPATIDGNKVVKIDSDAFKGNTNIVNLTLPDTLKEISDNAFANCLKLLTIDMPSCEKIRGSAFYGCTKLSVINSDYAGEVVFPKNLKEIKDGAFRSANVIRTVILPTSIEKLGNVFYRTTGIKNIYFPETIPQDAYKKTFLGGSTDFNTVNAFGTKDSYIATYASSEDAVDNSTADNYEKSGKNLYTYIEENSDILVMNKEVTVDGTKAGFNARLFNVGNTSATLSAIIAVYSEQGNLKGLNVVNNVNVPSYAGLTVTDETFYVENVEVGNNDVVRVMFWEGTDTLKPVVTQNVSVTYTESEAE